MTITPELIKHSISIIPEQSNEVLSHTWKVLRTRNDKSLTLFLSTIEKELRSRSKPIKDEPVSEPELDIYKE